MEGWAEICWPKDRRLRGFGTENEKGEGKGEMAENENPNDFADVDVLYDKPLGSEKLWYIIRDMSPL